tara:strand:+ start:5420 stop:7363 length:1944 start_codon:yes stop_codon:yes gene_type:complete
MKKNSNFSYQKEFDIFRAISVILVILFHLNDDLFFFGFVGVDIFFVVSGFVITQSLFNYYSVSGYNGFITNFFFRRIKRIYPALLLVLIVSILIYFLIIPYGDHQFLWTSKSLLFSIFGLSNIYFFKNIDSFDYFNLENTTPFLHTWSLGVEEQFYILYPFLLIFFLKTKINLVFLKILFLVLMFSSLFIFLDQSSTISHFYLLPSRAWELLLGSILFLHRNSIQLNINSSKLNLNYLISIFLIILLFFYNFEKNIDYRHLVMLSIITLLLVFNFKRFKTKIIFENNLIYLGKLSYSLYLWHFPILFFISYYVDGILRYILVLIITLILSHLSYNLVEIPARKIKLDLIRIKNVLKVFLSVIVVLIFSHFLNLIEIRNLINHSLINVNNTFGNINLTKNSIEYRIANKWFLDNDKCNNKIENFRSNKYLNCIRSKDNENLFFISGDSFAEHFVNVLSPQNSKLFKNIYLSKINNSFFEVYNEAKHHTIERFLNLSENYENSYFILSISYNKNFSSKQLIKFIDNLENKKIIIIQPHQRTNKWIKDCIDHTGYLKIVNSYVNSKKCGYDFNLDKDRITKVNEKLKKISEIFDNVTLYNFNNIICKNAPCNLYNKKNDLIYFTDNTHLTVEAAQLISQNFETWFRNEHF